MAPTGMRHGIQKSVPRDFDTTLALLPVALKSEGFGVLSEIDVQGTLRAKLGVDFRRYRILGVCNPALAHQALSADLAAGVMMPCNITLYEDGPHTVVTAVDPMQTAAASDPVLRPIAEQAVARLARVLERLG